MDRGYRYAVQGEAYTEFLYTGGGFGKSGSLHKRGAEREDTTGDDAQGNGDSRSFRWITVLAVG